MRITTSKEGGRRHLVLDLSSSEEADVLYTLRHLVLDGKVAKREKYKRGRVRYRCALKYLDRAVMAFPFAERSPAIDRRIAEATVVDLEPPPDDFTVPMLRTPLYEHQALATWSLINTDRFMENDAMGMGKTLIILAALLYRDLFPALVVTPSNGRWVWRREALTHTEIPEDWIALVDGTKPQRTSIIKERRPITVINFDVLRLHPELSEFVYEVLVTDEFHRVKNPDAAVTKSWLQLRSKVEWPASGTPMINVPDEIWPSLHRLGRPEGKTKPTASNSRYPSSWLFEKALYVKAKGSQRIIAYRPEAMLALRNDVNTMSIRRRRDQVGLDVPDVVPVRRIVTLTREQRKLYNQLRDDFKMQLESGEVHTVRHARVLMTRLKQAAFSPELYGGSQQSAKVDEVKDIVEALVSGGEKAILFSQWSRATRILQRELLQYSPAYVDGTVKGKHREAQADRFNEDPDCHLYIGTIGANREAITLGAATTVLFTDQPWSPHHRDQARDRSPSGGLRGIGVERVVDIDLFADETIEEALWDILLRKREVFNLLFERGEMPREHRVSLTLREVAELLG